MIDSVLIDIVLEIISVNPRRVVAEAKNSGMNITTAESFKQASYADIQMLMKDFAKKTAWDCAVSGATSGVGGLTAAVTLGSVDLVILVAKLYRLNQKCSIATAFPLHSGKNQRQADLVFLNSLGFDDTTSEEMRSEVMKTAAGNAVKNGATQAITARLIVKAVQKMGVTLSAKNVGRAVPLVGAGIGGIANYRFVKKSSDVMIKSYLKAYLDRATGEL